MESLDEQHDQKQEAPSEKKLFPFLRLSLRFKLTLPVIFFVSLMFALLFNTTYRLVRQLVIEKNNTRMLATAEVYAETLKVPLMLGQDTDIKAIMDWVSTRPDVEEVRLEDYGGRYGRSLKPHIDFPMKVLDSKFSGVYTVSVDASIVVIPLNVDGKKIGRVLVLFSQRDFNAELRKIFKERFVIAFVMLGLLALLTMGITWIAIRPLFNLKQTVRMILAGDLSARARLNSRDEIQDLGDAFNEMVSRLGNSLDRLRSRTEALEESEERFRLIVENASDIIFTITREEELVVINKGFSGCSREQFLLQGVSLFRSVMTDEAKELFAKTLKEIREKKEPVLNLALTHIHQKRKDEIFYLLNLTPVVGADGQVKIIQGVMRDVTEIRRIEMMKESLIRDVAHELKTPAAKFKMTMDWFQKEVEKQGQEESYKEILKILKNNIERLMHTITSIMDLSKLESGVDPTVRTEFDFNEVLNQISQDMEPMVREKGLDFDKQLVDKPLPIVGDKHMLYRLLANLVSNSIKFTEAGRISLKSDVKDKMISIEVEDTGMGIDEEHLDSIFERFVQKTASSLGIGVGLTICKDIANLHQGKIWAESKGVGKGAILKLELPMR